MVRTTDRALAIDAAAVAAISVAICLGSQHVSLMGAVVATVIALRFMAWQRLPAAERSHGLAAEIGWFGGCMVLGAANDWNSVTRHRIYDYAVPLEFPALSLVPIWMLVAWGLILRFALAVVTWHRLAPEPPRKRDSVWIPVFLVGLVLATRQAIYRSYADPIWSWLPFALAVAAALLVTRPDRRRLALLGVVAVVGPGVEVLYIQIGSLHAYHLGWLAGVPVWIVLWWLLAVLVLEQLLARLPYLRAARARPGRLGGTPRAEPPVAPMRRAR